MNLENRKPGATSLASAMAAALLCLLALASSASAQESSPASPSLAPVGVSPDSSPATAVSSPNESASPTPPAIRSVRISFASPPLEGTISLGIYDALGKLVRVLHRESETDDFTIGHDALVTEWDGRDDAGADLPAGKYHARGYAVGKLAVEGVDYFFNDWVTDENSPHVAHFNGLACAVGVLRLDARLADGSVADVLYDFRNDSVTGTEPHGTLSQSQLSQLAGVPSVIDPVSVAPGRDSTVWLIDHPEKNSSRLEVKQISAGHEVLRQLVYSPDDPQPRAIAAASDEDRIFVLEERENLQRVRGLTLIATRMEPGQQQAISDWKVDFEKNIVAHEDFALTNGQPVATGGGEAPQKLTQTLIPNALQHDKPAAVEVAIGFDADGSFLETTDGLPLRTISDTPHLVRTLLTAHGAKAIDVFQDDGAVVEQYRISNADQMMAFDCGDFELK